MICLLTTYTCVYIGDPRQESIKSIYINLQYPKGKKFAADTLPEVQKLASSMSPHSKIPSQLLKTITPGSLMPQASKVSSA